MTRVTCPDDVPVLPDFDAIARDADAFNDAAALGHVPRYEHRPITPQDMQAYLERTRFVDCGAQQNPVTFTNPSEVSK